MRGSKWYFDPGGGGPDGVRVGNTDEMAYLARVNKQSAIVSEFATEEEAAAYEAWLRAKVEASLADPRPSVPHDEVMASVQAIIDKAKASRGA